MDKNIFRAYDIRGKYPSQINEDVAYTIGKAYGSFIQEKLGLNTCSVGMDNRLSSPSLKEELVKGLLDSGTNVYDFDLCTTPCFYAGCLKTKTIIGIMVTASHNPKDENGFKFSFDNLGNARGKQVYDFRDYVLNGIFKNGHGTLMKFDPLPNYLELFKESIHLGNRKLKVIIDCGNGVTTTIVNKVHDMFNLDYEVICGKNDGTFPIHHPDPSVEENMELLKNTVTERHADIGIAYDGDGDRVGIVDNLGNMIPIDIIMAVIAKKAITESDDKRILFDVKCGMSLIDELNKIGAIPFMYRTGASYTRAKVNEEKLIFGGELSGHLFFRGRWPGLDSGIYSGLRLLEILTNTNESLNEIISKIPVYFNTPEIKVATSDDTKFDIIKKVKDYALNKKYDINDIDGVRISFKDGWALVRASNTGPNLTMRFEAKTEIRLEEIKKEFTDLVNSLK